MTPIRRMTSAAAAVGAVTFLVIAALVVAGCGNNDDEDDGGSEPVTGNEVDRAFVADMVEHHQLAIEMSEIASENAESDFVRQLADEIIAAQTEEIHTMQDVDAELAAAGIQPGDLGVPEHLMGMSGDLAALKTANPFDPEFIEMMIAHHQGAIRMAQVEQAKGEHGQLLTLAASIIEAQTREIEEMNAHLEAEGGKAEGGSVHEGMEGM